MKLICVANGAKGGAVVALRKMEAIDLIDSVSLLLRQKGLRKAREWLDDWKG